MDQRAPFRCQKHSQLNGLGPQCYSECRQVVEPSPVKVVAIVEAPKVKPAVKVERPAVKARKALAAVTNTAVTNADRQASWRSRQDPVALRGQARERMKGLRAQRKAGKAVGS